MINQIHTKNALNFILKSNWRYCKTCMWYCCQRLYFKFQIHKASASHTKAFLDIIRNVLLNNEIFVCISCWRKL
jgi:hypothetical protein